MKFLILGLALTSIAFASESNQLLQGIGEVYVKTDGPCADYVDVMPWFDYPTSGRVSFAQTNRPGVRPLEGYVRNISIEATSLRPLGEGVFVQVSNQPVPVRAEYVLTPTGITLYMLHKGKGSFGSIFSEGGGGFSGRNERYSFAFEEKNADGQYTKLTTTWQNLKGIFNSKKQTCTFTLQP